MGLLTTLILLSIAGIISLIVSWTLLGISLSFGTTVASNIDQVTANSSGSAQSELNKANDKLSWQAWLGWIYLVVSVIAAIAAVIIALIATVFTGGVDFEVTIPALILALGIILILNVIAIIVVGILSLGALFDIIKSGAGNQNNILTDIILSLVFSVGAIILTIISAVVILIFWEREKSKPKREREKREKEKRKQEEQFLIQLEEAKQGQVVATL